MQPNTGRDALSTRAIYLRANEGDKEALEKLLVRMRPRLRAWVALRMGPVLKAKLEADDLVQEILIKAAGAIQDFEPRGNRAFYAWLFTIARNQINQWRRTFGAAKRTAEEEQLHSGIRQAQSSPSTWASRNEELDHVLQTLTRLPERHREVIRLRSIEFLSNAEAAAQLGITRGNASVLYVRAMTALREKLRGGTSSP
ncbi:MAG: sigma-70 family RNA polymerase sigma factor [Planctomycetota bacterium]|jgi:RNA polymerase sigma-70 factor (ECF subfamily)